MSLFRIYVDGALFYHPQMSKLAITQAQVQEDAESIDCLTLAAPFNHPYLSSIVPLASTIVCKKGSSVVFEGRALDNGTDFYNTHTWTCESCLAYLKDTIQPPYDYSGTLRGLLELFVSVHNSAVETKKQFAVGNVTVTDDNDYIAYSNSEFSVTLDAIRDKLIKTHGGFLQVRYVGDIKYLDYIADFDSLSPQTVEYGKNLLDVKINRDHSERASVLIPLGAEDEETGERLQITSVNDGKNYVIDDDTVSEIGKIWRTEIWEDVTVPGNLLRKAQARLLELIQGIISMELTIVDESDTGADIGDIHAGMYVACKSPPHGIDGTYRCMGRTRDYLNPAENTITIGASGVRLTGLSTKQNGTISALEENILGQTAKIEGISDKVDDLEETVSELGDVDGLKTEIRECYSEIEKTSEQIQSTVRDNYLSKDDLTTIQQDFQTAITQASSEIRMDFTSITNEITENVSSNFALIEEYIRFRGALIELGKVGNAFTAELSNESLSFKENGQEIAYISNQSLVITNAEIRNRLSLGTAARGWFDFIPRVTGNLSVQWRDPTE